MPRSCARFAFAVLLVAAMFALSLAPIAAEPLNSTVPSTLDAETLSAVDQSTALSFPCSSLGSYTASFDLSGTAAGPYPGTFTETGTLSYTLSTGTPSQFSGSVNAFTANFTITSPDGTITGTKTLQSTVGGGSVVCGHGPGSISAGFIVSALPTTYQAIIATPGGTYQDQGTSTVGLNYERTGQFGQTNTSTLAESFASTLSMPILIPSSIDECLHGGWMNFPQFNNQGACVSFVARQQGGGDTDEAGS